MKMLAFSIVQFYNAAKTAKKHLLKEILFEIGFIDEVRTTSGNKEVPQTFFHHSPHLRKCILIRFTLNHWQPCIS